MPKKSPEAMADRRARLLDAARVCFIQKGFAATTIGDICKAANVSAGGLYTHFQSKAEIAAAIGGQAVQGPLPEGPAGLIAQLNGLLSPAGEADARLDLNLWSAALADASLHAVVTTSMNAFRARLSSTLPKGKRTKSFVALVEAIALGMEVQRALGRPQPKAMKKLLLALLED